MPRAYEEDYDFGRERFLENFSEFAGMMYYPTLLIGVGGTGAKVLRRVKRKLVDKAKRSSASGSVVTGHRFLYIDTDTGTFADEHGLADVENHERVLIGQKQAPVVIDKRNSLEYINSRFPPDRLSNGTVAFLRTGVGAGQIRGLGALAYTISYTDVIKAKISQAINTLTSATFQDELLAANPGTKMGSFIYAYVVGSLAGGTGSGCFLDISMTVKGLLGDSDKIIGVFALPEGFVDQMKSNPKNQKRVQANTYAALKELNYIRDVDSTDGRKVSITYDFGPKADKIVLKESEHLFYCVYLFDVNKNTGVSKLPNLDALYSMMAETIYQDVGTPIGSTEASADINLDMAISTAATSSLVFPAQRIVRYCRLRAMNEYIHSSLLKDTTTDNQIRESVTRFLDNGRLEERYGRGQITDRLIEGSQVGVIGLDINWGRNRDADEFVARLKQEIRQIPEDTERVMQTVEQNLTGLIGKDDEGSSYLSFLLTDWLFELATYEGIPWAMDVLAELEDVLREMKAVLEAEVRAWAKNEDGVGEQNLRNSIDRICTELRDLSFLERMFTNEADRLKRQAVQWFNDLKTNMLRNEVKRKAFNVVEELQRNVDDQAAAWTRVVELLELIIKTNNRHIESAERRDTEEYDYSAGADIDVTIDPLDEKGREVLFDKKYFEDNKPSLEAVDVKVKHHVLSGSESTSSDDRTQDFIKWLYNHAEKGIEGAELVAERFSSAIEEIFSGLYETDINAYIQSQLEKRPKAMEAKLENVFSKSLQPHLLFRPPDPNTPFPEKVAIKCCHVWGSNDTPVPHKFVKESIERKLLAGADIKGDVRYIPSNDPLEIMVSRRTHDIKPNYLIQGKRWKMLYENLREEYAGQGRMIHSHMDFSRSPDLYPRDEKAEMAFALGMALGFIAQRGNYYYFVLHAPRSGEGYSVQYKSDWTTINDLDPAVTSDLSSIEYEGLDASIPMEKQLANGRSKAREEILRNTRLCTSILKAVGEFQRLVGNRTMFRLLNEYLNTVLKKRKARKSSTREIFQAEYEVISEYCGRIEI